MCEHACALPCTRTVTCANTELLEHIQSHTSEARSHVQVYVSTYAVTGAHSHRQNQHLSTFSAAQLHTRTTQPKPPLCWKWALVKPVHQSCGCGLMGHGPNTGLLQPNSAQSCPEPAACPASQLEFSASKQLTRHPQLLESRWPGIGLAPPAHQEHEGDGALEQAALTGCGVLLRGGLQNPPGHGPRQPALGGPA